MPERQTRLSRRRILQIIGVSPLAVLATQAEGGTGVLAVPAKVKKKIPDDTMGVLIAKGQITNAQKQKFIEVVETLWVYCRIGADHAGFPFPEPSDTGNDNAKHKKIVTDAYDVRNANDELSGDLIKAKLANWAEWEELTNVCAFDCGYNAAWAARDMDKTELDPEAYRMGYRQTERRMKSQMNRVRRYNKIWGRPEMENLQLQRGGGC